MVAAPTCWGGGSGSRPRASTPKRGRPTRDPSLRASTTFDALLPHVPHRVQRQRSTPSFISLSACTSAALARARRARGGTPRTRPARSDSRRVRPRMTRRQLPGGFTDTVAEPRIRTSPRRLPPGTRPPVENRANWVASRMEEMPASGTCEKRGQG